VDKTIGYELRCASPIPLDEEHARDLGYAAVKYLQAGGTSALVTMQNGDFTPMPLGQLLDPETGKGEQRFVDVTTESYQVARDYMVRLKASDFADEAWLETLAKAAAMDVQSFRERFGKFA
jgi:6-phosphofructokinase 1